MQRTTNEDRFYVDPDQRLLLVLDGMGGHRAGEVAAELALETMSSFFKAHETQKEETTNIFENFDPSFTYYSNLLRQAAFVANRVVLHESVTRPEFGGMGCTVAGMALNDFTISMVNVGDSRMYLIRNGGMEQISRDHTLAEDQVERGIMSRQEARESQLRHILSAVIGVDTRIRVHMDELAVLAGDIVLLCTDGLTAVMEDEEILTEILKERPGPATLERLIDEVNGRGGPDNVTLLMMAFSEEPGQGEEPGNEEAVT